MFCYNTNLVLLQNKNKLRKTNTTTHFLFKNRGTNKLGLFIQLSRHNQCLTYHNAFHFIIREVRVRQGTESRGALVSFTLLI